MIQNARRLTRETCLKENLFFDGGSNGNVGPNSTAYNEKSGRSGSGLNKVHASDETTTTESRESVELIVAGILDGIISNILNPSDVEANGDEESDRLGEESATKNENYSDSQKKSTNKMVVEVDSQSDSATSGERDSRANSVSGGTRVPYFDTHTSPIVHPLHEHILLYTQKYDAKRTLYALQCLKSMLGTSARLVTCALTTANIGGSMTPHIAHLVNLLVRHRQSVKGKNFHGEQGKGTEAGAGMRSSMFVEVLVSVCLYFMRSYYPNLMMSKLSETELIANKDIQIMSCDILSMLLAEFTTIARTSGRGFATYIRELLTKCKASVWRFIYFEF